MVLVSTKFANHLFGDDEGYNSAIFDDLLLQLCLLFEAKGRI